MSATRKSCRTALLVSASALAFVAGAPTLAQASPPQAAAAQSNAQAPTKVRSWHTPQGGDVAPAWGDIEAFWGDINPFWGDIDAFWGDIDAFQGSTPYWGDIDAFWGDIDAFEGGNSPYWGDIDAFWGDIDAFWGDIDAFWGDIDAFQSEAQWGDIDAFWGDINPFWGDIDAFWGDIDAFHGGSADTPAYGMVGYFWHQMGPLWDDTNQKWGALGAYSQGSTSYAQVQDQLSDLVAVSKQMFGPAVAARTGQSFEAGFADEMLTKHGIDLDDPSTLAGMSAGDRAHFFMDWYDGLMAFSGVDRVDHWMAAVKWSPVLTQIQGEGADSVIGLLDMTVVGDPDVSNNITSTGGYSNNLGGHGTGVASLMVAAHDGEGLMGIAPRASVVAYNPFDNSATASWDDVRSGVIALRGHGASVINMSLGVSGWTLHGDWKDALAGQAANTVYVVAAGNAGASQTTDIAWNFSEDPALIVVGSVDPDGNISDFSNRPGSACLLDNGVCSTDNKLMNRFLVAPGELILVSDGEGGVTRRSGTSFAAPLVTGAVALLHDRWPWLEQHPHESVDIILKSAKDLGAPGVDAVYGWGMLDITASQSPLNFNDLTFKEYKNGVVTDRTAAQVKTGGVQTTWEADGVYFKLYEEIGDTYRDFAVPMSSSLVGQKSNVTGSQEYFQSYITSRLTGWISGTNFSDTVTQTSQQPGQWSFAVTTGMPQQTYGRDDLASQAPHMSVRMADPTGRFAFSFGHGEGAMVMGQLSGFAQTRDYRSTDGGVNPLLGFASGGPFMNAEFGLTKNTTLSFGAAERTLVHRLNPALTDTERDMLRNVDDYRAGAVNLRLDHKVSDALSFNAGYARVDEANGLLGVQSTNADDLASGSVSHVATVGASVNLPSRMTFAASASVGETKTNDSGQNLATVGGVQTTAYAVALTKQGLIGKNDMFRVAFTQPLTVSHGTLAYTSVDVIDRQTGELGPVSQKFDITVKPRHVAEALYATPVFAGQGEVSFFGRAEVKSDDDAQNYMAGVRLNLNY